ncbi:hypothetical protein MrNuV_ORF072 [Macrobrachium rosenbergii nudivirus]|nr:hypothetical protein MrNuV_ORF072 [Macrobrachium rosenbergii nudivirus]
MATKRKGCDLSTSHKIIKSKLLKSFVIDIDDDESDEEEVVTPEEDVLVISENVNIDEEFAEHIKPEEKENLQKLLDEAKKTIVDETVDNLHCVYLIGKKNVIQDEEKLMSSYEKLLKDIKLNNPNNVILIPFYINEVRFKTIKWLKFNVNPYLSNRLKIQQLDFLYEHNPAMWTVRENFEYLNDHRKNTWISMINNRYKEYTSRLFEVDDEPIKIIFMEYNYLNLENGGKGLCGLCAFLCSVDQDARVTLLDIANIKISCNSSNRIYGDLIEMLKNNPNVQIFIYTPQMSPVTTFFNNFLLPWCGFLINNTIINIITKLNLTGEPISANLCIDNMSHYTSCSLCNCLNLYVKIITNQFTPRKLNETINATIINTSLHGKFANYSLISCKYRRFLKYGNHNSKFVKEQMCMCCKNK